jgi:type IV pilus assembly protein PilB
MAGTAENKTVFVGGGNGAPVVASEELEKAQDIARRYRCQFVDLHNFQLHHDLFKNIPVHLMFRYRRLKMGGWPSRLPIPAS